uniref:Claudin n=1 Tax=Xiphophorus couchianus TaxID=32473 RepID=A0A3B5LGQ6_9TELE
LSSHFVTFQFYVATLSLGFGSWILVYVSLVDQYWKESTQDGSVILTSAVYENLWMSCASDSTGVYDCREFPSLLALPGNSKTTLTERFICCQNVTRQKSKIHVECQVYMCIYKL